MNYEDDYEFYINIIDENIDVAKSRLAYSRYDKEKEYKIFVGLFHVQQALEMSLKCMLSVDCAVLVGKKIYDQHCLSALLEMLSEFDKNFINTHQDLLDIVPKIDIIFKNHKSIILNLKKTHDQVVMKYEVEKAIKIAEKLYTEIKNERQDYIKRYQRKVKSMIILKKRQILRLQDKIAQKIAHQEDVLFKIRSIFPRSLAILWKGKAWDAKLTFSEQRLKILKNIKNYLYNLGNNPNAIEMLAVQKIEKEDPILVSQKDNQVREHVKKSINTDTSM